MPNGIYQVYAVSGDPSFFDGIFKIDAETVRLIDGVPSTGGRWIDSGSGGKRVTVADGRLTLASASGAMNNKLNYVEIIRVPFSTN